MPSLLIVTTLVALLSVPIFSHPLGLTTLNDAKEQQNKKLRCWEKVPGGSEGKYQLSEPVYDLCSYMPSEKSFDKSDVNGVDMDSDDYSHILALFNSPSKGYAMLSVCLHEAFQFARLPNPSVTSIRCLCKRSGCNIPGGMYEFLTFNKSPIHL